MVFAAGKPRCIALSQSRPYSNPNISCTTASKMVLSDLLPETRLPHPGTRWPSHRSQGSEPTDPSRYHLRRVFAQWECTLDDGASVVTDTFVTAPFLLRLSSPRGNDVGFLDERKKSFHVRERQGSSRVRTQCWHLRPMLEMVISGECARGRCP